MRLPVPFAGQRILKPIALLIITIGILGTGCRIYYTTTPDSFTATKYNTSFEHGRQLAFSMCAGCHYNQELKKFSGKPLTVIPKIAGHVYASNLTQSKIRGVLLLYTDAELAY